MSTFNGLTAEEWARKAEAAADFIGSLLDVPNLRVLTAIAEGESVDGTFRDGLRDADGIDDDGIRKAEDLVSGILESIPERQHGGAYPDLRTWLIESADAKAEAEADEEDS